MSQNPFQSPEYGYPTTTAQMAAVDERATFIRRTYIHLLGAILACIAIDAAIFAVFYDFHSYFFVGLCYYGLESVFFS